MDLAVNAIPGLMWWFVLWEQSGLEQAITGTYDKAHGS
jgi:hypothetical protein